MGAPTLPWYSILYRLLGAQGTFWLWMLCALAVWWTAQPTLIRIVNTHPEKIRVREVDEAAHGMRRWVQMTGVELRLDLSVIDRHSLEEAQPGPSLPPIVVLADKRDPAIEWWLETHRLAVIALSESSSEQEIQEAQRQLRVRFANLSGQPLEAYLPKQAILVQDERTTGILRPPLPGILPETFEERQLAKIRRVAELVKEGVEVEGVLEDTPIVVQERIRDQLGLKVASYLLQSGRKPRDVEGVVFGIAAILLVFLSGGLYGASRVSNSEEP